MGAEKENSVTVSFTCRLENGTPFELGEEHRLRVIPGRVRTMPTLERGIVGLEPGERRVIAVPAQEVNDFLRRHPAPARGESRPGFGYDFGPGEGGDVLVTIPQPPVKPPREVPAGAATVLFEVALVPEGGVQKK